VPEVPPLHSYVQSRLQEKKLELFPPEALLTTKRLDVAVKWRYFRHLLSGSDPDSERVYRGLILARNGQRMLDGAPTDGWKLTIDHWVDGCAALLESMRNQGFIAQHPIPLDKNGELLNGTHRLACAMALRIDEVWVWRLPDKEVWAPEWGLDWLIANAVPNDDIRRIGKDFEALCGTNKVDKG